METEIEEHDERNRDTLTTSLVLETLVNTLKNMSSPARTRMT